MSILLKSHASQKLKSKSNIPEEFLPDKKKIDIKTFSSKVLTDLYKFSLSKNKLIRFFFSSRLHLILILEIVNAKNNENSFEYLCEKIDKQLGKRTTIQKILNDAIKIGLINKVPSKKDKRVKYFSATNEFTDAIETWILQKN